MLRLNPSSFMKSLFLVTAAIELGAGLALVGWPSEFVAILTGAPLDAPAAFIVARVGGFALLALSVACWQARQEAQSHIARGLIVAMLLYNVATAAILSYAWIGLRLHGMALWPAVVLHVVMAAWCVASLRCQAPE